jgi:small-conductance mechanosensitive channel
VHILTKVFVLIASVLSIMMAALAISYSVNADRITADYNDSQAAAVAAINDQAAQKAAHGQERAALQEDKNKLQDELASRDADTRRLEASNSELRIALRQAEAARESISSKIAQLGVTTETQAKIIDEYKTELSRLREAELSWRNDKIDLEKSLSDLESQVIVYEQVKRALQEQIEELRLAMNNLQNGGSSASASVQTPTEISGPLIRGSIDEVLVDQDSGDTLVKINLGSNDRIRENTRLYIHRDNTIYLGELVIFSVDLNHAVGRVAYVAKDQSIRAGDQVMSKIGN